MSEFIGSRISLISRSDIRYVGTLHEINSETSTVALENVSSFGTEGRKGNPDEEIPQSEIIYEYIVFRGSDVKDLRIEEAPAVKENAAPQMPNDPAILGTGSRPSQPPAPAAYPAQPQQHQATPPQSQAQQGPPSGQQFPPQQYPPHFYGPPPGQWGRGGPPPGPGYPGMPPPGWYPPPGQGFPQPGPFPYGPYGPYPPGPHPGPSQQLPQQAGAQPAKPPPIGPSAGKQQPPSGQTTDKAVEPKSLSKPPTSTAAAASNKSVTPASELPATNDGQKDIQEAPSKSAPPPSDTTTENKSTPTGPKNGRIIPVIPLQSPATPKVPLQANAGNVTKAPAPQPTARRSPVDDATRAATAAVAAAMAKLPPVSGQQTNGSAIDNLTRKVNEMRTSEPIRTPRQPGTAGFGGQRGRGRGGNRQETRKIDVPTTDFDFEESNAKFNKQEMAKEVLAVSPAAENSPNGPDTGGEQGDVVIPSASSYNKKSSFFDDLSSELKDRAENQGSKPGGREWRGEEQKRNLETFGQGSVDNGYRGGYRGRGRGRGGMRGRGYSNNGQPGTRGRGGYRGGRGDSQTTTP